MVRKIQNIFISTVMVFLLIMLIVYSKDTALTIKHCIEICTDTLIPSIFAYMVLCTFLINSGLSEIIATPLWYLSRRIIKLDKKLFSAFLLSIIAGYPVGVKMLKELISQNKNYSEIVKQIAPFCYASGPAFVIGIAGNIVYNSFTAGMIIFISCTISNIIGLVVATRKNALKQSTQLNQTETNGKVITASFLSSARALLIVCLSMILFNLIITFINCFLDSSLSESSALSYIKALIEITNIYTLNAATPLWLMTFFISFGGLCVIFQVYIIADGSFSLLKFIITRFFVSVTGSIICFLITEISGYEVSIPATYIKTPQLMLKNPVVLFSVSCMTLILLAFLTGQVKYFKKNKNILKKD